MTAVADNNRDVEDALNSIAGDTAAFEQLYRRYLPNVRANACWLLSDHDVDDAVQEVFIRLWQKMPLFEQRSTFNTWFTRLTINVLLNYRNARSRRSAVVVAFEDEENETPARDASPDLALDLESAIASLPNGARDVLVFHDVHGFDHEEIAALLGIAASTSRSQLARARFALRNRFDNLPEFS
ncbi:MAG: sigma-70 family RNA polymerase sigma factor [Gemmatimonadaceae bacterium]